MNWIIMLYALLILISLVASIYTLWAYHHCPDNRSHRPLIFPIVCSMAWFLVGIEQLVAYVKHTHGSVDGFTMIGLVIVTLVALLYFVKAYVLHRQHICPLPGTE